MNKLIEIIKPYFSHFMGGTPELIAKEIAEKIVSSGFRELNFETIQQAIIDTPDEHKFSDGYHTFESLYDILLAYNVALFNEWAENVEWEDIHSDPIPVEVPKHDVHKSQRHHDGELCFGGGWFIVVANLPSGQISNHYETKHWDLFRVPSYEKAKYEWDGHTSEDVINRLKSL